MTRLNSRIRWSLWACFMGMLILAPADRAGAQAAKPQVENVTVRTGWLFSGYDAGYFVAIDKGFYAEEGLKVELGEGRGSVNTMQIVAQKNDTFGFVDGGVLAIGVEKGVPIKMLAAIFQVNPQGLAVLESGPIKSVKDMAGARIGVIPGANTTLLLRNFLLASGLDPAKAEPVNIDPANLISNFLAGNLEVITVLGNFQPPLLAARGKPVRTFLYADAGLNTLSVGITAHPDTIAQKPVMVRRFVKASLRGLDFAVNNPEAAADILMKHVPNQNKQVLLGQLRATFPLLRTERTKGQPLGWMHPDDWRDTQEALVKAKAMNRAQPPDKLFTNDFIPK